LSLVCGWLAAAMIVVSVAITCQMIFVRFVLNLSTVWQTEAVTYPDDRATLVGLPYVQRLRGHVNVDLLPGLLPPPLRKGLALLVLVGLHRRDHLRDVLVRVRAVRTGGAARLADGHGLGAAALDSLSGDAAGLRAVHTAAVADLVSELRGGRLRMDPDGRSVSLVAVFTILVLFSGVSVANGLLIVSAGFLLSSTGCGRWS
jgi:hypothetical protein